MKKLRLVILSFTAFSLFCSLFFNLAYVIYDKENKLNNELINSIKRPLAGNLITFIVIFAIVLIWYLYHRKDRAESITNGLVFLMYLVYLVFFIFTALDYYKLYQGSGYNQLWFSFSLIIFITPGMWLLVSIIPLFLHFIASVSTNGYDNVPEPDNIYGFMFTISGICYLATMIVVGVLGGNNITPSIFAFKENGLVMVFIVLTFILCAGLRFNFVILDIFNIVMHFAFIIIWFVIMLYNKYSGTQTYLAMYHFIFLIPMFVLSFFILNHFIKVDRFYKGITKNFLKDK